VAQALLQMLLGVRVLHFGQYLSEFLLHSVAFERLENYTVLHSQVAILHDGLRGSVSWPIISRVNDYLGQWDQDVDVRHQVSDHLLVFNVASKVQNNADEQVSQLLELRCRKFGLF
jgi:hypothetical protein